jgi:hypothetical protein
MPIDGRIDRPVIGIFNLGDFEAKRLSAAPISATSLCGFLSGPTFAL